MRSMLHVMKYEWRSLWRSNTLKALILVVLFSGIYGIYFGKFELDKQNTRIDQVKYQEQQQFDSLLVWARIDTTVEANKTKYKQAISPTGIGYAKHFTYYLSHEADLSAGLCLGQRDLFPSYYGFNVSDLSRQTNVGELANPLKLLTGNFDLSYVFVFIFPLLIVALFYNLFAVEKEGGTLSLLQSQPVSLLQILTAKAVLRLLIVWSLAILLLLLGFVLHGISLTENSQLFGQWLYVVCRYCFIWTILICIIVSFRRSASLSAMLGLGVWLIFTLIAPAVLNLLILAREPLPNRYEMVHELRKLNDAIWENPKSFVFDQYYAENPHLNTGDTTDFNKWYYAGFTLLDQKANSLKVGFEEQVSKRNALLEQWDWLAPAAKVHERLSQLSQTDRQSHLNFMKDVHAHHEELKDFYYTRIFEGKQFSLEDLQRLEKLL